MKAHTKVYMRYFSYAIAEDIFCEICSAPAKDLHHIRARGMGGSKQANNIENLMALCRSCHESFGDKKQHVEYLQKVHQEKIDARKAA